jgi:AraC family transcriptional regulator
MRVELIEPETVPEPRLWVEHQQVLALVLRPGSVEWGLRRSEMQRVDYSPGEMGLCRRHEGEWVGIMEVQSLTLGISDAALKVACDGISGEVELHPQRKFQDPLACAGRGRECGEGWWLSVWATISRFRNAPVQFRCR